MQHPSTDHTPDQKSSAPAPRPVHYFDEGHPQTIRQTPVVPTVAQDPGIVGADNGGQPVAQNVITRPRGWRPLYEIIDDGSIHSSPESQAATKSAPPAKPRMSFLFGCIMSAFVSSIITVTLYEAIVAENEPPAVVLHSPLAPAPTDTPIPTATAAPIKIFISGSVRNVGVYEFPVGARIEDAIVRAGGLLAEADPERVNRAMKLSDGAQIHIPARTPPGSASALSTLPEIPPPPIGLSGADAPVDTESDGGAVGQIDLNSASLAAIEGLPGIGASKAQEIVAGRPYSSADDLQKVSGIGAKTVDKLREFITVE